MKKEAAMFQNNLSLSQKTRHSRTGSQARQYSKALSYFNAALGKGKLARLKSRVLQRPQSLYDLNALKPDLVLRGRFYSGMQVVAICSIIGSEGRTTDFDRDFRPLREALRERWVSLAMMYLVPLQLPAIELIQVGDAYFVRDGHHRLSVSRAFGQLAIDAQVITWKALPPFPWQSATEEAHQNE